MPNSNNAKPRPALNIIDKTNDPLVKPEDAKGGRKNTKLETASDRSNALSAWAAKALETQSESLAVKAVVKSECAKAVQTYFETVEAVKADETAGQQADAKLEDARQHVARKYADAVLAGVYDRSEMRNQLGVAFGFALNPMTDKITSKPLEPGNTIAKRVSSVTIAAEYAMTGQLPDRGGDSLPIVGKEAIADLLADYFDGEITVRAASERIEKAIREARTTVPLEMDADKLIRLAGKIQSASEAIAGNPELQAAYIGLFQTIASIPFPMEAAEAA